MTDASISVPRPDFRPLFAANLVCSMSVMGFTAVIGPLSRALELEPWHAGLAVTMAGFVWMLTSRSWGRVSDRVGRRPVLLASMTGFALTYLALCAFATLALADDWLPFWSVISLVALRSLMGAFYAALPAVGNAMIADAVAPEKRAGTMAGLGAAGGIGLVAGPALAASLVSFGLVVPLYVLAALPLAGILLVAAALPRAAARPSGGGTVLRLGDPRIRPALLIAFVAMFCVGVSQITIGFFVQDRFSLSPEQAATSAGIAMTVVGVSLIAAQAAVSRIGWPPRQLIMVGAAIGAVGYVVAALSPSELVLWLAFAPAGAGMGLIFPAFSALAANSVGQGEQGSVAGSVGAAQGFGMVCGPLVGAALYGVNDALPYYLCAMALVAVAINIRARVG
jgi:DHA1 family tetracycline resistance protein-like MFS transporter